MEVKIESLVPDDANFNKGTEKGGKMISKSLEEFGAGRSIVLDKNGRIIAGNKTVENAIKAGIKDVLIVESTGDKLIAVKRTDVNLESKKGRELALADNATSQENILFDYDLILSKFKEHGIDNDWISLDLKKYEPKTDPTDSDTEVEELECMCPECLHEFNILK